MSRQQRFVRSMLAFSLIIGIAACGEDSNGGASTATATPSPTRTTSPATPVATPTTQPTTTPVEGAVVSGLVVVNQSISGPANDRLGAPPAAWTEDAGNAAFDKALGLADWLVTENESLSGTTGADGQFTITGVAPGHYTLLVTKTIDGNLLSARVPFTAGDDGAAVVAEVSWGLVRSVSTYVDDGVQVREVRDPSGRWLITRDGRITELGDGSVTLSDPDGDGSFDVVPCVETLWACGNDGCGDDRVCGCVSSCPFCEDCGATACQPAGLFPNAYRCSAEGTCQQPGDRCVCVSSCPECDDCPFSACVSDCQSVTITAITINGAAELIAGEQRSMYAVATLSNNRSLDVTALAEWTSSNTTVATVDAFGTVTASAVGTTTLRATLDDVTSNDWTLNVVARPSLRRIYLQNVNCYYPLGDPRLFPGDQPSPPTALPPIADAIWWPSCNQIVRIGATIQFRATGEFGNGTYYQDITDEVAWQLTPAGVGTITAGGLFTAQAEGAATLTASLDGITSDGSEIRVVTKATVTMLSIYADQGPIAFGRPVPGAVGAAAEARPEPCFECGYTIPVLRGDELHFRATAHYDTGEWQDVTGEATWRSSNAGVASIDAEGTMMAITAGTAIIDATFEDITSNPVTAQVVNEATLQYLFLQSEGTDRVVVKGGQLFFRALGSYDIGFQRDITDDVTWHSSNDAIGGFATAGVFITGREAGTVQVWAESGTVRSEPINLEVYETSDVTYCDAANVNRGLWSDDFNRVTLESDCKQYTRPGIVMLRYSVTETQPHGGIFDPCLDLYVYQGNQLVRTLREEGCGEPFLPASAPELDAAKLKYQLRAFWDLKDEAGQAVAPGTYTIFGRFYLYYDPVVSIDVDVQ